MTRKLYPIVNLLILAAFIMTLSSCKEEKDPCDDTKWENTINYSVQPKLVLTQAKLSNGFTIKEAANINVLFYIQKYHCGGNLSQIFFAETNHDPRAIDDEHWYNGFYVGKVIGFDFNNDEDYLAYKFSLEAMFEDGTRFFSPDIKGQTKPPFIPDWTKNYFYISVNDDVQWSYHPPNGKGF